MQKRATEAEKTLSVIKQELESNHRLKAYYSSHWEKVVGQRDIANISGQIELSGKKEGAGVVAQWGVVVGCLVG